MSDPGKRKQGVPSNKAYLEDNEEESFRKHESGRKHLAKMFLTIGGLGSFFLAAGSILFAFGSGFIWMDYNYLYESEYWKYYLLVPGLSFLLGLLLHSFSYLGFFVNHRSFLGLFTFIYSMIASAVFGAMMIESLGWEHYYIWRAFARMSFAIILVGIAIILMGITLMADGYHIRSHHPIISAGKAYIASGCFIVTVYLAVVIPIGWLILFPATVLAMVSLSRARSDITTAPVLRQRLRVRSESEDDASAHGSGFAFCPYCGVRIDGARRCGRCGRTLEPLSQP